MRCCLIPGGGFPQPAEHACRRRRDKPYLFYNHVIELRVNTVFIVITPHRVTGVSLSATLRRGWEKLA